MRKWKKKGTFGGEGSWIFEVGELPFQKTGLETEGLAENSANVKKTPQLLDCLLFNCEWPFFITLFLYFLNKYCFDFLLI